MTVDPRSPLLVGVSQYEVNVRTDGAAIQKDNTFHLFLIT
jgi:hypothetical protein